MALPTDQHGLESSAVVKQGLVEMRSKHFGIRKKRWLVLLEASSLGPAQLLKFTCEKHAKEGECLSRYTLNNVSSVVRSAGHGDSGTVGVTLQMLHGHQVKQFFCDTEIEANQWLDCLKRTLSSISRRDSLPAGLFRGYIMPSGTLDYSGECVVEVNHNTVTVYENDRKSIKVIDWPIKSIRRYSKDDKYHRLKIESGRGSPMGEGVFLIRSYQYEDIHQMIEQKAMDIRRSITR